METKTIIINKLESLIKKAREEYGELSDRALAVYLAERSVIAAPVEIGQEVYAACTAFFDDEAHMVEPCNVKGIRLGIDGKLYAIDGGNEDYEIGSALCCLTREEAEKQLWNAEFRVQSAELEGK